MRSGSRVGLHPAVVKLDVPKLDYEIRQRINQAIKTKLSSHPTIFGEPLRSKLKNLWKLRVGSYRIIYMVNSDKVYVYAIGHRSEVYKVAKKRLK